MKTSRKILLALAAILLLMWTVMLFVARQDMKTIISASGMIEYREVPVERFHSLDFSSNWKVTIRQGKDCEVEIETGTGLDPEKLLAMDKGTLKLQSDQPIHARIKAPVLSKIRVRGNSSVLVKNFWSDSLSVILEDRSSFHGSKNDFEQITFKSAATAE